LSNVFGGNRRMFLQFGTNDYVVLLLSNNTNIQNKVDSYLVKRD